ncbi:TlyA family RNA methyltransferase [Collinsella sp. AGMB00827]|uniref:TlyA family RNA methyltransferase n=1 Tax=Collinsella ureilytica TaxID=2869515 RepID=A0ABS7ML34_9ACTN|nr:TlyA family RNA methyltransferase [Collinsella urealyticum]MBY4798086.1 TlyA family RNA methyltransferase [Collinsella urealyticum]
MARSRLDDELVAQGFCANRDEALRLLMAGLVSASGERLEHPGMRVEQGLALHVRGKKPYVGRGGIKLAGALAELGVDPAGLRCLDVGASTGGFTDCLLQHGASHVTSVDVGRAQFAWELREDPRVALYERTNITVLDPGAVGRFDVAVCDVSFTSIERILPAVLDLLCPHGRFLTLVKPQFEARPDQVESGGVVRDPAVRYEVVCRMIDLFASVGLIPQGVCSSSIRGAKGNREYFLLGERVGADVAVLEQAASELKRRAQNI